MGATVRPHHGRLTSTQVPKYPSTQVLKQSSSQAVKQSSSQAVRKKHVSPAPGRKSASEERAREWVEETRESTQRKRRIDAKSQSEMKTWSLHQDYRLFLEPLRPCALALTSGGFVSLDSRVLEFLNS